MSKTEDAKHAVGIPDAGGYWWLKPQDDITPKEAVQCIAALHACRRAGIGWMDYVSKSALRHFVFEKTPEPKKENRRWF